MLGAQDNVPVAALNYASLSEMTNQPRDVCEKVIQKVLYVLGRDIRSGRVVLLTIHRSCELTIGKGELRCFFVPEFLSELRTGVPIQALPGKNQGFLDLPDRPSSAPIRRPVSRENHSGHQDHNRVNSRESYTQHESLDYRRSQPTKRPLSASASPRPSGNNNNTTSVMSGARAAAARALGTELIIDKLRQKIVERGGSSGITGVARLMKIMDDDGSHTLSRNELKSGLRDYGIDLSPTELEQVFLYFDRDASGTIDIDEFLRGLVSMHCTSGPADLIPLSELLSEPSV